MSTTPGQVKALRAAMWRNQFRFVPVLTGRKKTTSPNWHQRALLDPPAGLAIDPPPAYLNTGLLCDGLRVVDIDVDDAALAGRIFDLSVRLLGSTIWRFRRDSPRRALLYAAQEGEPGKAGTGRQTWGQVEILGCGNYLHAFGTHDAGAKLRWTPAGPDAVERWELPHVGEDRVAAFLAAVLKLTGVVSAPAAQSDDGWIGEPDSERITSALSAIPSEARDDREGCWRPVGMALHHEFAGGEEGYAIWEAWSAEGQKFDPADQRRVWKSFNAKTRTPTALGTLFRIAKEHGWKEAIPDFQNDQDGLAMRFTRLHPDSRYDTDVGRWYSFNGCYWAIGPRGVAFHWARQLARDLKNESPKADRLGSRSTFDDIEAIVRRDPAHEVESDIWNPDVAMVGTPRLTIDSKQSRARPARKDDMITKVTRAAPLQDYNAATDCPMWRTFLEQTTGGDKALIRFLQQWCGYCLTGETKEHALVFLYGPGGNGKSVFVNTVRDILGDYAVTAGMDVFSASNTDRHPQELARLTGVRLVCASETTEGRSWDEARIKVMTGGDPVTARFMRMNDFTYTPQFKVMIAGNNKPVLRNVDDAMRRRINIVPFTRKPETPDYDLESKLRDEWPAILSWMIAGCADWRKNGLIRPETVIAATAEYFESQDSFGQWLDQNCETGPGFAETTATLMGDWMVFAHSIGEGVRVTNRMFADRLRARGFHAVRDSFGIRGRGFSGLRLTGVASNANDADDL